MTIEELRKLGYSYREIAEKMNISVNTVKSYCERNYLTVFRLYLSKAKYDADSIVMFKDYGKILYFFLRLFGFCTFLLPIHIGQENGGAYI